MTTVTFTGPVVPAGAAATICVAVSLVICPGLLPKSTSVASARFAPVIVTAVPPEADPAAGLILVTVGAAR